MEPPSAGKAVARPTGAWGKDVGGVRPPSGGGPYRRHEVQGRTWADDCPGPAILPAPAADQRLGARIKGPTVLSQPPPAAHRN